MLRLVTTASPLPAPLPAIAWPFADVPADALVADNAESWAVLRGERVALVGGEPLLRAELLDWLGRARAAEAASVEVWTDGRVLARRGAAERLKSAGLSHVAVVLFGAEAAAHDYVAGVPGHFDAAIRGLRIARKVGLRTAVVAPILRPTFRDLPLLVQRAAAIGVERFELVALPGPDRAQHGLLPHLGIAAPHLRQTLATARRLRRQARTWWVPFCLLGEGRNAAVPSDQLARNIASHFTTQADGPCQECGLRPSCSGPLAGYAAQHGIGGLRAQGGDA